MTPRYIHLLALPLLALASISHGADFDDFLATLEPGTFTGTSEDFVTHVTWKDAPAPAHYQCREDNGEDPVLELWQGEKSGTRDRFGEQSLVYGENGDVRVLAMTNDKGQPWAAAYFMLPSGETHLFRLHFSSRGVTKAGKKFQCNPMAASRNSDTP